MTLLGLVFISGFVGSGHCLGMCGPLVVGLGSSSGRWQVALARQAVYTFGRIFTYSVLGACAGYGGQWLVRALPHLPQVAALVAVAAGLVLIQQGLAAAGLWRFSWKGNPQTACLAGSFFGPLLRQEGLSGAFLAGLFTGLLPCGLLYGMLALAASTHDPLAGAGVMAVFALGGAPALALAGLSGRLVSVATRRRLFAFAAWCLMATGVMCVARGVGYLQPWANVASGTAHPDAAACPLCHP